MINLVKRHHHLIIISLPVYRPSPRVDGLLGSLREKKIRVPDLSKHAKLMTFYAPVPGSV